MGDVGIRRVLYISGTRADYGPARAMLRRLNDDPDIELGVLVTGMHLDPAHGESWREIESDGLTIVEKVHGRVSGDQACSMSASVGLYLYGMSQAIDRLKPDIVLVLGDRGEQLAATIAAATQNIPVAHLCGGSLSGSIDDSIRHAITKFAHLHLVGFQEHADRVIQMGEDPASVKVVGLPGANIQGDVVMSKLEVCATYGIEPDRDYILVLQHAVTHSSEDAEAQIIETLEALSAMDHTILLANPNDDAGGRRILSTMETYAKRPPFKLFPPPLSRERFASVMAHASVLVGNSSSAVVEAMSVGLPVVNVGDRQQGREHLACWINVGYDRNDILEATTRALSDETYMETLKKFSEHECLKTEELAQDYLKWLDLGIARYPKKFYNRLREGSVK